MTMQSYAPWRKRTVKYAILSIKKCCSRWGRGIPDVEKLGLCRYGNELTDSEVEVLFMRLSKLRRLKDLRIDFAFKAPFLQKVMPPCMLKLSGTLEVIRLSFVSFSAPVFHRFARILSFFRRLTLLSLTNSKLCGCAIGYAYSNALHIKTVDFSSVLYPHHLYILIRSLRRIKGQARQHRTLSLLCDTTTKVHTLLFLLTHLEKFGITTIPRLRWRLVGKSRLNYLKMLGFSVLY